jgi:ketosteroid isomerase-like protein
MSVQQNKATIAKVNDAFRQNNTEAFLAACTENVLWTMVGDSTVKGKDGIRKWMASMPGEAPKFTIKQTVAEGDYVTCIGEMTMKDKDGRVGPYSFCDVYRFEGDKIAELNAFVVKLKTAEV